MEGKKNSVFYQRGMVLFAEVKFVICFLRYFNSSLNNFLFRKGNLEDVSNAGTLHEFLLKLHNRFGPIASFWWEKTFTVSVASAELFEEQLDIFDRPRKIHFFLYFLCT